MWCGTNTSRKNKEKKQKHNLKQKAKGLTGLYSTMEGKLSELII